MEIYKKVFVTPLHEDDKKHINSNFYNLKEGVFTKKVCDQSFIEFTKVAMSLFKKLSQVEKYDYNQVSVIDMKSALKNIEEETKFQGLKDIVLLAVPTLTQVDENLDKIVKLIG